MRPTDVLLPRLRSGTRRYCPGIQRRPLRCAGPGPGGGCAREPSGASVACAGKLLRVDGAPSTVPDFVVPEGFDVCPVTWVLALSGAASSSFLDG